jgi:hypothetical protein
MFAAEPHHTNGTTPRRRGQGNDGVIPLRQHNDQQRLSALRLFDDAKLFVDHPLLSNRQNIIG